MEKEGREIRKVLILRGLQGSGKSTFAKQWVNEDPEHRVRFNRDDMRNMLGKYWVPSRETLINDMYKSFLESAIFDRCYNVVIDNMNLDEKYINEIKEIVRQRNEMYNDCEEIPHYEIEVRDFFHIPLQVCIERDAQRENPIGAEVITRTYNKYKHKILPWRCLT